MSLILGMLAALSWGVHDLCVRHVSSTIGIFASVIAVFSVSCLFVIPISIYSWTPHITPYAFGLSLISGIAYGLATLAHYKAFSIGPIQLSAPIIGTYPVLSIIWAIFSGVEVSLMQWGATGMIIAGVAYVAASTDDGQAKGSITQTILWSLLSCFAFAVAFIVGQETSVSGNKLALLAPTRVAALLTIFSIALMGRVNWKTNRSGIKVLTFMGVLDAIALAFVIYAGGLENPQFAIVGASTFGMITIVLAAVFLREHMRFKQWIAVAIVFTAIAYLGL